MFTRTNGERKLYRLSDRAAYPQDQESNEYRYIFPNWLNEIAIGLTKARKSI